MKEKHRRKRKGYELIYKTETLLVPDYFITEEEYFDYYQDSNDPTFENYRYKMTIELVPSNTISYFDTVLNILSEGKKLSILVWQDFKIFISQWLLIKGWNSCETFRFQNEGIHIVAIKEDKSVGFLKSIFTIKKYSPKRSVSVRAIRELGFQITKFGASKGAIITTSRLSKEALRLVEENQFTMFYIDNEMLEKELNYFTNNYEIENLPF